MTLETAQQPNPRPPGPLDAVQIGLWGPQQSGKTTYLAALTIAESDVNPKNGSWIIFPRSPQAKRLKAEYQRVLVEKRRFPGGTVLGSETKLEWLFVGDLTRSKFDRRLLRWGKLESRFLLDLIDVQGSAYSQPELAEFTDDETVRPADQSAETAAVSAALDHLAEARGIIFLFDPIAEQEGRDSAAYVHWTVNELLERAAKNDDRPGRYLPHQVSVCVTKFDDVDFFYQARKSNLVTYGHDGMPRVLDEHAEQFFDELCSGKFWDKRYDRVQGSAEFVRKQLRHVFNPANIRYFVTSSIGFRMEEPTGDRTEPYFNPDNPGNVNRVQGMPSIIGKVRPINVLEPLISLQQRITRG